MWGSYVGALVGLYLYPSVRVGDTLGKLSEPYISGFLNGFTWFVGRGPISSLIRYAIIGLIVGFLIGWIIHSLIRLIRSKK